MQFRIYSSNDVIDEAVRIQPRCAFWNLAGVRKRNHADGWGFEMGPFLDDFTH
jgi:hypothetical protein